MDDLNDTNLIESLKLIHNIALYHSEINLEEREKAALYDLKLIWEKLSEMNEDI